ncbi:V-set and immunoglobulin domain-containing protein 8b [Alosa sapidissima]|uniref:V-set and immunoglobulin domain-containing protein 8b n=1 Tax=Alosa sapidissima TaxID=34773 RepID=UPI001C09CC63|nr:V-set and immunoglobulin domain-containing protein 8b [Alosa sapidissima]
MEADLKRIGGWCLVLLAAMLLHAGVSHCMVVTSTGPQTIKKAQGESVSLGCTYSPSPSDTGALDIEWSIISPDMTQKDKLILSYSGGQEYRLGDPALMKRLRFVGVPGNGDATIEITSLLVSDTATYQCKVKKTPGVDSRKVTVVVLVRPSVPTCWVEGGEEKGASVSLRCKSASGSTPLTYTWRREEGGSLPPTASINTQTGELLIRNHSESYIGRYACQVKNEVGTEQCTYTLRAYNPVNKAGVIAGAVIGALLLLLLLLLLIWLLICCCNKRRYEKEVANEIREDVTAPESRPASRVSSMRSIMGYHTHSGIMYSSVSPSSNTTVATDTQSNHQHVQAPAQIQQSLRIPSLTTSMYKPQLKYDSRYGYPV